MSVSVRQAVLMLVGVGMGLGTCGRTFRFHHRLAPELIEHKDPQDVAGQVVLLALASLAALPLLGQFSELHAALGPPSVSLLVGAFVFGLTMQIADGCGSGTLYKAGLGVPLNMAILPLFALGSFLGSVHLDRWLALGQMEPVSFSATLGTGGALGLTLLLLAVALAGTRRPRRPGAPVVRPALDGRRRGTGAAGYREPAAGRPALGGSTVSGSGRPRRRWPWGCSIQRPTRSGASRATPSASPRPF